MLALVGVTVIAVKTGAVTMRDAVGEVVRSNWAEIPAEPAAMAVARPADPVRLLIVATAGLKLVQVANDVKSCTVPSRSVPEAENC